MPRTLTGAFLLPDRSLSLRLRVISQWWRPELLLHGAGPLGLLGLATPDRHDARPGAFEHRLLVLARRRRGPRLVPFPCSATTLLGLLPLHLRLLLATDAVGQRGRWHGSFGGG
jgi:hypothetical protein